MKLLVLACSMTILFHLPLRAQQHPTGDSVNGLVSVPSTHSVDQTVERIKTLLSERGVTLFALVDHSAEAAKAGLKLRPTKLLIFGNPKAGTPLMNATPSIAIDLPLKILVWEDEGGKVWLSYNAPSWIAERHHLPPENRAPLAAVESIANAAAQ